MTNINERKMEQIAAKNYPDSVVSIKQYLKQTLTERIVSM